MRDRIDVPWYRLPTEEESRLLIEQNDRDYREFVVFFWLGMAIIVGFCVLPIVLWLVTGSSTP